MVDLRLASDARDHRSETLALWDYRRRVESLYAEVRRIGVGEEAWQVWRQARDELFATHPQSAIPEAERASFTGLSYFPYDPSWRIVAEVEPAPAEAVAVAHSDARSTPFTRVGVVHLSHDGRDLELCLYWLDTYGGGMFLPFSDATNGAETYGGGRYLLDTAKGADLGGEGSMVVLDFNFAYHPSCVHDPRWSCPLAPRENRLDHPIAAGERLS